MVIALIASGTSLLVALFVCAAIMGQKSQPCFLHDVIVFVGESRFHGGTCAGKPENLYLSTNPATAKLDGMRACNGHLLQLQGVADALTRESK
jgi:hypothetical protein